MPSPLLGQKIFNFDPSKLFIISKHDLLKRLWAFVHSNLIPILVCSVGAQQTSFRICSTDLFDSEHGRKYKYIYICFCMSGMLVNQLVPSDVFFHWLSFVVFLIFQSILSTICLLTLPSPLFAGFIFRLFLANIWQITIEANKKVVNFLDVTLDLNTGKFKPYTKPMSTPLYVHSQSNHPPNIIRNIPAAINRRLSSISSDRAVFNEAAPPYQEALRKSGYTHQLEFKPPPQGPPQQKTHATKRRYMVQPAV